MQIEYAPSQPGVDPGVNIYLTGDEVATAIDAYLVANSVRVIGPRTIRVNGDLCQSGHIYVDPSGFVETGGKTYRGGRRSSP